MVCGPASAPIIRLLTLVRVPPITAIPPHKWVSVLRVWRFWWTFLEELWITHVCLHIFPIIDVFDLCLCGL